MADNIHQGHRERMYARVINSGFESLSDHELLEMMLFYSIPRANTNGIAHALLDRFGSVKGVLDADMTELMTVSGVGERSARMIRMLPELLRRYLNDGSKRLMRYDTAEKIGNYLYPEFLGSNREKFYMMMFNDRSNLLGCELISEGVINCSDVMMRKISELVIYRNATSVIFAHNHPGGMAIPSEADKSVTEMLRTHMDNLNVVLIDHLIFADQKYTCLMKPSYGIYRMSPLSQKIDPRFFEHFYGGSKDGSYTIVPDFPGFVPQDE